MERMSENDFEFHPEHAQGLGVGPWDLLLNPLGSVIGGVANVFAAQQNAKGAVNVAKEQTKVEAQKTQQTGQLVQGLVLIAGIGAVGLVLVAIATRGRK